MTGVLPDNDIEGQFDAMLQIWLSDAWREIWSGLGLTIETFETLGLDRDDSDERVWTVCQARRVVLITGNRNAESPDSLESTIRRANRPDSLPVVTIANPRRLLRDRDYATAAAIRLLDALMDIERSHGCGRLYVP